MKIKHFTVICAFWAIFTCSSNFVFSQSNWFDSAFQLVWNDDFDNPSNTAEKWCRDDWRRYVHNNNPSQAYRSDGLSNVQFDNDTLIQVVKREQITFVNENSETHIIEPYTYQFSAPSWFMSNVKIKYGYFEIRCKLPDLTWNESNLGIGANFWMFWHDEIVDPPYLNSEIDIFEFLGKPFGWHTYSHNAHFQSQSNISSVSEFVENSQTTSLNRMSSPDFSTFHTFSGFLTPQFIKYYIDGFEIHHSTHFPSEMIPMRLVVDLNVPTAGESINSTTKLPYEYKIDYVRVYGLNMDKCGQVFQSCGLNGHVPSVYKSITIGNLGCNYSVPSGTSKTLWASDHITLQGDITIPIGSDFTLQTVPCHKQEIIPCNPTQCVLCK